MAECIPLRSPNRDVVESIKNTNNIVVVVNITNEARTADHIELMHNGSRAFEIPKLASILGNPIFKPDYPISGNRVLRNRVPYNPISAIGLPDIGSARTEIG